MKKINKLAFFLLALAAMTGACTREDFKPTDGLSGSPVLRGAVGDAQPVLNPICGAAKTYALVSEDGSLKVNRCFAPDEQGNGPIPCSPGMENWGTVTIMNGVTEVIANYNLADGWFGAMQYDRVATSSAFTFSGIGLPIMNIDWTTRVINPVVGKWQVARNLNETGNTFALGSRLTVVRLNALGEVIAGSATTLWLKDLTPAPFSTSPYIANWSRNVCVVWPTAQNICTPLYDGLPLLPSCTILNPTVTSTGGPLNYAWSTGATTRLLPICPSNNTTYTVSVTDNNGPRAVINYNVNLVDISCGTFGASVRICHIPPGNPNGGVDQCITWLNLAAHVAQFRSGNFGSGWHDSGCKLGRCNSNPCN